MREPERSEGSGSRSSPHPGEPRAGAVRQIPSEAKATVLEGISGRYYDKFREANPSAAARNASDATRLWEIAEKAVD